MKYFLLFTALIAAAAAASIRMAPLLAVDHPEVIPEEYIVMFHKNISEDTIRDHHVFLEQEMAKYADETDMSVKFKYGAVKGYSAKMSDRVRDKVRLMPEVEFVEANQKVGLAQGETCYAVSAGSWGIARTCETVLPREYDYIFNGECFGQGVDVYVIDTGLDVNVDLFEGRAVFGADFINDGATPGTDPNGHGTHVAGTVASIVYGLAYEATVHGVRVLNSFGSGTYDQVIAGVDWVTLNGGGPGKKSVINMSLGGGTSDALHRALEAAELQGVHNVVAAGNENTDACTRSPAASDHAITVGATDINDARASFSNYGDCVQLFAPGVNILSPAGGSRGIPSYSGTSMASPHVAGIMARLLSCAGNNDSPAVIKTELLRRALPDIVTGLPAFPPSPNLLLHLPCEG